MRRSRALDAADMRVRDPDHRADVS
jgi:hypothetical protein